MTDLKKLYQSELPNRAIAVYLYLRGRANKEGVCWPAIPTMARELKMSESTIRRALRDLVREGFLVIEERHRESGGDSSNKYILAQPLNPAAPPKPGTSSVEVRQIFKGS